MGGDRQGLRAAATSRECQTVGDLVLPGSGRGESRRTDLVFSKEPGLVPSRHPQSDLNVSSPADGVAASTISLRVGDLRWQVAGDWQQDLIDAQGLRLDKWLRDGAAQVIKQGAHRTVYRVDLPHRRFFIKHDHPADWRGWLRGWLRPAAAWREWLNLKRLVALEVPTVAPVAVGCAARGRWRRDNFLVSAAIPDAVPVDQFLREHLPRRSATSRLAARRAVLIATAEMMAQAHMQGVRHNDLHLGNLLVQSPPGGLRLDARGRAIVHMIDVPGMRMGRGMSWRATRHSLAMLWTASRGLVTAGEAKRFWIAYCRQRPALGKASIRRAEEIEQAAWRLARRLMRSRDKRVWHDNREYRCYRAPTGTAHAVRDLPPAMVDRVLQDPAGCWRSAVDQPVKLGHRSALVRAEFADIAAGWRAAFKRLRAVSARQFVRSWWYGGKAAQGWYWGHALAARGIATPRPWLLVLPRARGWRGEQYLLCQWLEGTENLHELGWRLARLAPRQRSARATACANALGHQVGRLHYWGLAHRDLKACNWMVGGLAENPTTWLVDVEGVRRVRWLSWRRRVKNLARLAAGGAQHPWLSQRAIAQFFRAYALECKLNVGQRRQLRRAVLEAANRRNRQRMQQGEACD